MCQVDRLRYFFACGQLNCLENVYSIYISFRYCLIFTMMMMIGLVMDPFPKLFPGYFIAKLLLYLWANSKG